MLAIFYVVLEMSWVVIILVVCMRIMVESPIRDCGWQGNYSDAIKVGTNNNIV
jgi:hypothetical protein